LDGKQLALKVLRYFHGSSNRVKKRATGGRIQVEVVEIRKIVTIRKLNNPVQFPEYSGRRFINASSRNPMGEEREKSN
jgi:hypothetical protein